MDTKVLPDGSVEFQVKSEREVIRSEVASAFISNLLAKMQNHSEQTGDFTPLGGAVVRPDTITVEFDLETGDPRLRLGFGKALLVMALPKGEMKKLADAISKA